MHPTCFIYHFIARFFDGSIYQQNWSDSSVVHPLTRSAFWDVAQRLTQVRSFTLTNGIREHTVFLNDGHFKTDGREIVSPHGQLTNYRLIYFRRVQQSIESGNLTARVAFYFIGWQANDVNGKKYQMMLEIVGDNSMREVILQQ